MDGRSFRAITSVSLVPQESLSTVRKALEQTFQTASVPSLWHPWAKSYKRFRAVRLSFRNPDPGPEEAAAKLATFPGSRTGSRVLYGEQEALAASNQNLKSLGPPISELEQF